MANPEHLAILEQGVEVWNEWRQKNPEIRPDLSSVTLIGANLRGRDPRAPLDQKTWFFDFADKLEAERFSILQSRGSESAPLLIEVNGVNLENTDLREANLRFADLTRANLTRANLTGANLSRANLTQAYLTNANLSETDLLRANLY